MKLICDKHRHRIHVLKVPTVSYGVDPSYKSTAVVQVPDIKVVTVHRKDGSHCDSTFLRMGRSKEADVFTATMVADAKVRVRQLAGYKEPKRKDANKRQRYAVSAHRREVINLPSL